MSNSNGSHGVARSMKHGYRRYTGAGNTFVVMDTLEAPLSLGSAEMAMLVTKACRYEDGIGADGVILINESFRAPFRMDYYNPDGSTGMLCGNGARCAVMAAKDFGFVTNKATEFEVLGSINHADLLEGENVRVYFQDPTLIKLNFQIRIGPKQFIRASYADVGTQHVVIMFDELRKFGETNIEQMTIRHYGPTIRWHPDFAPRGTNANFIEVRQDGDELYLRIRTFERGVEGETLACGTGCMSAAIVAHQLGLIPSLPIRLLTQSGEYVIVNFSHNDGIIRDLSLEGSAIPGEKGTFEFDEVTGQFDVRDL